MYRGRGDGGDWNFGRGRGRGRGYSHRGGGGINSGGHQGRGGGGQRGRGGMPPGLRGKEIGLWFARMNHQRREKDDRKQRPAITFDNKRELLVDLKKLTDKLGNDGELEDDAELRAPGKPEVIWRRNAAQMNEASSGTNYYRDDDSTMDSNDMSDDEDSSSMHADSNGPHSEPDQTSAAANSMSMEPSESQETVGSDYAIPDTEDEDQSMFAEFGLGSQNAQPLFLPSSLIKDGRIDDALRVELERRRTSEKARQLLEFRRALPAYQRQKDFVDLIKRNRVVVVSGLTGCGKSTQLPQALLDDQIERGDGSQTYVVCTQPRRISAISLAERVAAERGETLKETNTQKSVGYQIRLESRLPRDQGSLLYCTTGIVLRWLSADPTLSRVSHLFLDEIHERDLQSDLLLILIRDLLTRRTDLRVILMSATLEADTFLNYFAIHGAVLFEIAGRSFPVQSYFLEDVYERIRYQPKDQSRSRFDRLPIWEKKRQQRYIEEERRTRQLHIRALRAKKYSIGTQDALTNWRDDDDKVDADLIRQLTRHLCDQSDQQGAILIFVPGRQDIKDVLDQFVRDAFFSSSRFTILPLHSMIPTSDQQKVFARPPPGSRKIIVSTNIAETSVTIDDVIFVIDSGKIKRQNFDKDLNCQTLKSEWVSKANAVQRQGRAGRCQPGTCFHLFPSWKFDELDDRSEPEMRRTRLTSLCLEIKALTKNFCRVDNEDSTVLKFLSKAVDPPDEESVKLALDDLYAIGALTREEGMTPLGWQLLKFPVDPHCGKMIIYSALFSCVDPVLTIAACLDYKVPFHQPFGMEAQVDECKRALQWPSDSVKSDYLMWVTAYNSWAWAESDQEARRFAYDHFLSGATLTFVKKMKKQFAELLFAAGFTTSADPMDPAANTNSSSEKVIESVVATGLYPKVAFVWKQLDRQKAATSSRPPMLRIKSGQKVKIHPSSVNNKTTHFETQYLIYQTSVKSTACYLHECAMVSPLALCFAGNQLRREHDILVLDGWIKFYADDDAYQMVAEMRKLLRSTLKWRLASGDSIDQEMNDARLKLVGVVCNALNRERLLYRMS